MDAQIIEILKWASRESAALVLLGVMFFVYRKDVHSALDSWQGQTKVLMEMTKDTTAVLQRNTDALESLTDELRRTAR